MTATRLAQKLFIVDAASLQNAVFIYRTVNDWLRLRIIEMIQKARAIDTQLMLQILRPEPPVDSALLKLLCDAKMLLADEKAIFLFDKLVQVNLSQYLQKDRFLLIRSLV